MPALQLDDVKFFINIGANFKLPNIFLQIPKILLPGKITHYPGVPDDANQCTTSDGSRTFYAPKSFDMNKIVQSGANNGKNLVALIENEAQFGTFDFQRVATPAGFNYFNQYRNVSNFGVGAYLFGAGYTEDEAIGIAASYASSQSSNAGSSQQSDWWKAGYEAAKNRVSNLCRPAEE